MQVPNPSVAAANLSKTDGSATGGLLPARPIWSSRLVGLVSGGAIEPHTLRLGRDA